MSVEDVATETGEDIDIWSKGNSGEKQHDLLEFSATSIAKGGSLHLSPLKL